MDYKIDNELADDYAKRESKKKAKIMSIVMFVFLGILFYFTYSSGIYKIILLPITIVFALAIGLVYALSLNQLKEQIELTVFTITDEEITKQLDKSNLNLINKIGLARIEARYGVKLNQTIRITDIDTTEISENEITISSNNFNALNENGKIVLPKELANYATLKADIIANSKKYRVTA